MRIVVNHLTRMDDDHICIAGINPDNSTHVRPVTSKEDPLTTGLLKQNGGPLAMGATIEIGEAVPRPVSPEVEDHRTHAAAITAAEHDLGRPFTALLRDVAEPSLEAIFGPELKPVLSAAYGVEVGEGRASLGVAYFENKWLKLEVDGYGKLRLISHAPANLDRKWDRPAVNAVEFYESDNRTVDSESVSAANERLESRPGVFVMYGLTRPRQIGGIDRELHWLQVNGLHFA